MVSCSCAGHAHSGSPRKVASSTASVAACAEPAAASQEVETETETEKSGPACAASVRQVPLDFPQDLLPQLPIASALNSSWHPACLSNQSGSQALGRGLGGLGGGPGWAGVPPGGVSLPSLSEKNGLRVRLTAQIASAQSKNLGYG